MLVRFFQIKFNWFNSFKLLLPNTIQYNTQKLKDREWVSPRVLTGSVKPLLESSILQKKGWLRERKPEKGWRGLEYAEKYRRRPPLPLPTGRSRLHTSLRRWSRRSSRMSWRKHSFDASQSQRGPQQSPLRTLPSTWFQSQPLTSSLRRCWWACRTSLNTVSSTNTSINFR